jgi:hypothetical protein
MTAALVSFFSNDALAEAMSSFSELPLQAARATTMDSERPKARQEGLRGTDDMRGTRK